MFYIVINNSVHKGFTNSVSIYGNVKLKGIGTTVYDLDLNGQPAGMYLVSIVGAKVRFDERVWVD